MLAILNRIQYITLFLIALYALKLRMYKQSKDVELRYFWLTLTCCFLLALQDTAEYAVSHDPSLLLLRILLSMIGYILRPVAIVGLLLVVCPPERRSWKIWIPCIINTAVNLTAFFSPLAFFFNEDYAFRRGPLGYCVFIVAFLYMVQVLVLTWRRFYEVKKEERWILIGCAIGCIGAAVLDISFGGTRLNEAMMISSLFLYIFLRSHDNYLDPLTSLRNRFAFYEDSKNLSKSISAVASLDMNGLKQLNDTKGHAEGDKGLVEIGKCLKQINGHGTFTYRIGGDEFAVLFFNCDEPLVVQTLENVKEAVVGAGYSISCGYAMKEPEESLEDALRKSDRNMYRDKAEYYQQSGIERRRTRV